MPAVAWAFFGLAVLFVGWYILNNGVYVGTSVQVVERPYGEAFLHKCKYLFTNGTQEVVFPREVVRTKQQASAITCPPSAPTFSNSD